MGRLLWLSRSSIGRKLLVATTGVLMVVFLIAHVAGNFNVFFGQDAMNQYGVSLREHPVLLWGLRAGLVGVFLLHLWKGLGLWLHNRAARPVGYRKNRTVQASLASRLMALSGTLVLAFLVYHLLHFTFGVTDPMAFNRLDGHGRHDVFAMVQSAFQDPLLVGGYVLALGLVGLHLWHGLQSAFQTFGLRHQGYHRLLRRSARAAVVLLVLAFWSVPLCLYFGLLGQP